MPKNVPTSDEFDALTRKVKRVQKQLRKLTARVDGYHPEPDPEPEPDPPGGVLPVHSDALLNVFGVNDRLNWNSGVYQHRDATNDLVVELGVRSIRDLVTGSTPKSKWDAMAYLASHGVRLHATVSRIGDDKATVEAACAQVVGHLDLFCSVGGTNEPNAPGGDWAPKVVQQQKWIWDALHDQVTVVGPALKDYVPDIGGDFAKLGAAGIADYVHRGDFHRYPRGVEPTNGLDERADMASAAFGGKPLVCTEGGYNTSASGVSEAEAAVYAPRQVLEMMLRGFDRFHVFELLDQSNDPGVHPGHFGLVACPSDDPRTWRKKASFDALRSLSTFLSDPGPYTPQPVSVAVEGPDSLRSLLVGKRDGSAHLILWRDVPYDTPAVGVVIYAGTTRQTVPVGDTWTHVQVRAAA